MRRREFIAVVGSAVACPRAARAQQSGTVTLPKIGFLLAGSPDHCGPTCTAWRPPNTSGVSAPNPLMAGIFTELQRLDWVDGRNAIYEPRFSAGDPERLPSLAADLVGRKVDIIVATGGTVTARAAQRVTTTIPIVALSDDLEGEALVASLAHSGSNTTGVSMFAAELNTKRVELLAEIVPSARRMAALAQSKSDPSLARVAAAARERIIMLVVFEAQGLDRLADALAAVSTAGIDAVNVLASSILHNGRRAVMDHMAASQLPAIYQWPEYAAEGGLMGYGPTQASIARLVAEQVDRVLRGARPAELPGVQPTAFMLAINLKTAKALGLTVPPSLLVRADEVIE
jgi:putative tryptophan/tyrosine transport system substrate-binding protein